MSESMEHLLRYVHDALYDHPVLADVKDKISLVLSGSRAVGYHVPSSDYDLFGICDAETYSRVRELAGRDPSVKGINIPIDKDDVEQQFGIEVDVAVYEIDRIRGAIQSYIDAIDTEACDILEEAMVSWGIDRDWITNSYHHLADVLFQQVE